MPVCAALVLVLRTFYWGSMHSIRARTPLREELLHQHTVEGHRGQSEHATHLSLRLSCQESDQLALRNLHTP